MSTNYNAQQSTTATLKIKKYIFKKPVIKKSIKGLTKTAGRNNFGQITIRHKGGGHKKNYRKINFQRTELSTGVVCNIEYDPNRNCTIAAIFDFFSHNFFYIITPKNLKIGDIIKSGAFSNPKLGHYLPIMYIPVGSYIHNLKLKKFKFAKIARAAGTFCKIQQKTLNYTLIKFNSGKFKLIKSDTYATIGIVSNGFIFLSKLNKAGQSRWLNKRPSVRGVAMNPIDHPNGGGEGKKSSKNKTP
jgi:large subunit ribosomal protein L2